LERKNEILKGERQAFKQGILAEREQYSCDLIKGAFFVKKVKKIFSI